MWPVHKGVTGEEAGRWVGIKLPEALGTKLRMAMWLVTEWHRDKSGPGHDGLEEAGCGKTAAVISEKVIVALSLGGGGSGNGKGKKVTCENVGGLGVSTTLLDIGNDDVIPVSFI